MDNLVGILTNAAEELVGVMSVSGQQGPKGDIGPAGRDGVIQYTAGDNIRINNDTISVPNVHFSNSYSDVDLSTAGLNIHSEYVIPDGVNENTVNRYVRADNNNLSVQEGVEGSNTTKALFLNVESIDMIDITADGQSYSETGISLTKDANNHLLVNNSQVALLSDIPADELPSIQSGDAGKVLKVNSTETGVEWGTGGGSGSYTAGDNIRISGNTISVSNPIRFRDDWNNLNTYYSPTGIELNANSEGYRIHSSLFYENLSLEKEWDYSNRSVIYTAQISDNSILKSCEERWENGNTDLNKVETFNNSVIITNIENRPNNNQRITNSVTVDSDSISFSRREIISEDESTSNVTLSHSDDSLFVNNNEVALKKDALPKLPDNSSDGTYVLKATKTNGTVTYTWVAEI